MQIGPLGLYTQVVLRIPVLYYLANQPPHFDTTLVTGEHVSHEAAHSHGSNSSLCFSIHTFSILCGMANSLDCQGKSSGLFHMSPKSSGSQHMGCKNG